MPDALPAAGDLIADTLAAPGAVPQSTGATGHAAAPRADSICANCHAALRPRQRFCHDCGQEAHLHPPSALEFVQEFIRHYVALEGALWRTLRRLFFSPGFLTQAWIAGRRTHFVQPLRIYLTMSIIFFLALRLGAGGEAAVDAQVDARVGAQVEAQVEAPSTPSEPAALPPLRLELGDGPLARALTSRLQPGLTRLEARMAAMTPVQRAQFFGDYMLGKASYLMFLLLPVYALLFKLAYLNRRMNYGAHVVFAFHVHAFAFAMFLLQLMPLPAALDGWPLLVLPLYVLLAMRRVYGGRWRATLLRATAIGTLYGLSILLAFVLLAGSVLFAV